MFGFIATELILCPGIATFLAIWIRILIEFTRAIDLDNKKEKFWKSEGLKLWRLDGYPSFGKASTGNPYITSSKNCLLGKATRGGPQASEGLMGIPILTRPPLGTLKPESFLPFLPLKALRPPLGALNLVLLACPQRVIFLLTATAPRPLIVLWQQCLQRKTKDMVQLVFHNGTFFYINSSWTNDPIYIGIRDLRQHWSR